MSSSYVFLFTVILQYMALSKLIIEYKIIKVVACFHKVRICCAMRLWWSITSLVLLPRNAVYPDFLILFLVPQVFHCITIISCFFPISPSLPREEQTMLPTFEILCGCHCISWAFLEACDLAMFGWIFRAILKQCKSLTLWSLSLHVESKQGSTRALQKNILNFFLA